MKGHITIKRKTEAEDFYLQLQEKSLKDVQQLSGELWTDYNAHDPGVTLLDALNYTLLEKDYRLHFDLCDYLTLPENGFQPRQHALFLPSEVFPVNPVTVVDYRKLFVSSVEDLSDVRVITHTETGTYDFVLDVWTDTTEERKCAIIEEVYALFHAHRNLCENIGEVRMMVYNLLSLSVRIEIDEDVEVNRLMACLFFEVQEFLRAGIRFRRVDELLAEGKTADEILEGPEQGRMVVDESSMCTDWEEYDVTHLYQKLSTLSGVSSISSLNFQEGETLLRSTLKRKNRLQAYALHPFDNEAHSLIFTRKGKPVPLLAEEISRILYAVRATRYGAHNRTTDKEVLDSFPSGVYRDLFTHHPIHHDLPACYEKHIKGQFKGYLERFDQLITHSLDELKGLPTWMSPTPFELSEKKESWMDLLDSMYGEDSNPIFLRKYECDEERRLRRINFLKDIPLWGLNRGRAMNLRDVSPEKESGVETYLKRLLYFERYDVDMFLLEHTLLGYKDGAFRVTPEAAFHLTVVFAAKERWLQNDEFRHGCEQLLFSRIPAHIQVDIYWKAKEEIGRFRSIFLFWKYMLTAESKRGLEELCEQLKDQLADDNNWYSKV